MNFYDQYKPLRNYFRGFGLSDSLPMIWALAQEVIEKSSKAPIIGRPRQYAELPIHPWQIEILCREIILNAQDRGDRDLCRWGHLAQARNHIVNVEDAAFTANGVPMDVMVEVHRIAHRQFPWQNGFSLNSVLRAIKIFGQGAVDAIIFESLGMTAVQATALGISIAGSLTRSPWSANPESYLQLGISRDSLRAYLDRISSPLRELQAQARLHQRYDHDWAYTFNPMVEKPLIWIETQHGPRIICAIPRLLIQRVTTGLYFDVIRNPAFSNPYGNSFEQYVGEVLRTTCPGAEFVLLPETPYYVGKQLYRGPDWIWSDSTGHVFIEAKTKRMRFDARTQAEPAALERELEIMAGLVVQHYANIDRALRGHMPNWCADERPIFPLIVTLEDWYLLGTTPRDILLDKVREGLSTGGLDTELLSRYPFLIVSINELESASQVLNRTGIATVLLEKRKQPLMVYAGLLNFVFLNFKNESEAISAKIFEADFDRFMDEVQALLGRK